MYKKLLLYFCIVNKCKTQCQNKTIQSRCAQTKCEIERTKQNKKKAFAKCHNKIPTVYGVSDYENEGGNTRLVTVDKCRPNGIHRTVGNTDESALIPKIYY